MHSFFKKMLIPCLTLALSALALQACSSEPSGGTCVPNSTAACLCAETGKMGVQTCQASGIFNTCQCNGGTGGSGGGGMTSSSSSSSSGGTNCFPMSSMPNVCGNGTQDPGEECDDGNCVPTDDCNDCKKPYCGDHVVGPGETCDGTENCPLDCGVMMTTSSSSSSSSSSGCLGQLVYAGNAAPQTGAFSYGGQIGLDAAKAACQALGGFDICDFQQWEQIRTDPANHAPDLTKLGMVVASGCQKFWLQRTTTTTDPKCISAGNATGSTNPGPGGNCNNFNYQTMHVADGEFVQVCNNAGTIAITYGIDCDTVYDPMMPAPHQDNTLPCNIQQPIPCCYEICLP